MPKKINTIVEESVGFLEKEYVKSKGRLKKDRIKTLLYIKTGKYCYRSDIYKKLGRSEKTLRYWLKCYTERVLAHTENLNDFYSEFIVNSLSFKI